EGVPYHHMFPSEERFEEEVIPFLERIHGTSGPNGPRLDECAVNEFRGVYLEPLLPGYEVWVGNVEGDAQPCKGDSGGPLFSLDGDDFLVHGVVSWGLPLRGFFFGPVDGKESACQFGAAYGAFGPAVRRLAAVELGLLG